MTIFEGSEDPRSGGRWMDFSSLILMLRLYADYYLCARRRLRKHSLREHAVLLLGAFVELGAAVTITFVKLTEI